MVYGRLLDAGLRYEDIPKRTLPQIEAVLGEWASLIQIKIPNFFGGIGGVSPAIPADSNNQNSQEDVDSFFNSF